MYVYLLVNVIIEMKKKNLYKTAINCQECIEPQITVTRFLNMTKFLALIGIIPK